MNDIEQALNEAYPLRCRDMEEVEQRRIEMTGFRKGFAAALARPSPAPVKSVGDDAEFNDLLDYANIAYRQANTAAKLCDYEDAKADLIAHIDSLLAARTVADAPAEPEYEYTYASSQATKCAGCGHHKHTPLRIDAMGGYVCLTCIGNKLGSLLGEFGHASPLPQGTPAAEVRDNALEEAANAVQSMGSVDPIMSYGQLCARAIRALRSQPAQKGHSNV